MKRQLDDAENPNHEEEQNVKKLRTIESEDGDQTKLEDTPESDVPVEKRSVVELSAENLIDGARTDEPEKAIEQPEKEEQQLEKEESEKEEPEKPEKEKPEKPEKEEPEKEGLPERAEHQLPEKEPPAEKASGNQEDSSEPDQEKGIRPLEQEHDEGEGDNSEEDLDDEISAAVEKAEGEEESESEAPAEPLDEKVEAAEEMHDRDGFALQKSHVVPTEAQQHAPIPTPGPRAPPILSHTRVKCQDCGSLISVCRRAGDSIVLLKCPVCCSYVAFDHLHSPTIIPYQERTDNFSCHTWNPTQLMVFLQQMGLGHILPYLAHHNIDGRAMMELFRGELRQRVGLQTEEQTQSLLTALNILRLGEGIA